MKRSVGREKAQADAVRVYLAHKEMSQEFIKCLLSLAGSVLGAGHTVWRAGGGGAGGGGVST